MSSEHACDACGGSGYAKPCGCHVCLGAGRISDRMPVADALADAETLQTVGPVIIGREPFNATEAERFASGAFRAVPGLRGVRS